MDSIINEMSNGNEVFFKCHKRHGQPNLTQKDIDDAWERIVRFSSYVKDAFCETEKTNGIIDSTIICFLNIRFLSAQQVIWA